MKAIIQRVTSAKISVDNSVVSSIGRGLCVLVGVSAKDTAEDVDYIVRKLLSIRLFEDDNGKRWNKSVTDYKYEILCCSQFTLYHKLKGNKPDFHLAMQGPEAKQLYDSLLEKLKKSYETDKIKDGVFGAYMQVDICNDGPVTIELESPSKNEAGDV